MPLTQTQLKNKWEQYYKTKDVNLRNELILNYEYLTKKTAGKLMKKRHVCLDFEDVQSYGVIGLCEAVESFNPEKNVTFITFAISKIKYLIMESQRNLEWTSRTVTKQKIQYKDCVINLQSQLGRNPERQEILKIWNGTEDQFNQAENDFHKSDPISTTSAFLNDLDNEITFEAALVDKNVNIEEDFQKKELSGIVRQSLQALRPNYQSLMQMRYYDEMSFREIAAKMNLTESRVYQIHIKCLGKMRKNIDEELESE